MEASLQAEQEGAGVPVTGIEEDEVCWLDEVFCQGKYGHSAYWGVWKEEEGGVYLEWREMG